MLYLQDKTERGSMPASFSIRLNEDDEARLDRLVVAVRAFYESAPPAFVRLAGETTRSSALRDLLLAWDRGDNIQAMFSRGPVVQARSRTTKAAAPNAAPVMRTDPHNEAYHKPPALTQTGPTPRDRKPIALAVASVRSNSRPAT